MSTVTESTFPRTPGGWFAKSEAWLDDKGKGAWIAAMVLGFIFFWPLGLALLAYMIWSKRMFSGKGYGKTRRHRHGHMHAHMSRDGFRPTGNTAFDAYKAETLQRLMDEQQQFEAFLDRLREAKDKREFDQFMDERASAARSADDEDDGPVVSEEPKA